MGIHLIVLSKSYPMNTTMTGFRCFFKNLCVPVLWTKITPWETIVIIYDTFDNNIDIQSKLFIQTGRVEWHSEILKNIQLNIVIPVWLNNSSWNVFPHSNWWVMLEAFSRWKCDNGFAAVASLSWWDIDECGLMCHAQEWTSGCL